MDDEPYLKGAWLGHVRSFVRYCGNGPAYSGPQRRDLYIGPMRQLKERRKIGRRVRCMCALRRVEEGTVGVSSLSGIFKRPPLGVAYYLAKPGLALVQRQRWLALLQHLATWMTLLLCLAKGLCHIYLIRLSRQRADTLTVLIKALATVTFYPGHRRTLLPDRDKLPVYHVHRNY